MSASWTREVWTGTPLHETGAVRSGVTGVAVETPMIVVYGGSDGGPGPQREKCMGSSYSRFVQYKLVRCSSNSFRDDARRTTTRMNTHALAPTWLA